MATLQELYQHKRFCEEQGYPISEKLLQDIEEKEKDALFYIPDWAVNTMPIRTEVDDYTGSFTVLVEYNNNVMVGAGVSKDFSAIENSDFYIDARKEYPELFEDSKITKAETEPEEEENSDEVSTHSFAHRSKSIGFTVHFADGKIIDRKTAVDVMIDALKYMGLEKASKWEDILFKRFPLVGKRKRLVPNRQKLIDGWYIYVNMPNHRKIACLKGVANMLGVNIEIRHKEYPSDKTILTEDTESSSLTAPDTEQKTRQKYVFNGSQPMPKNRVVLYAIKQLLNDIPNTTYKELEEIFPRSLQGGYGVFETLDQIEKRKYIGQDVEKRYFLDSKDILTSSDGIKFAVCTQWDYRNFPALQQVITNYLDYQLEEFK